jgi:uncharacterized RDD family membrane protein YckC
MISPAMAVAAAEGIGTERGGFAREARSGRLAALMVDTIVLAVLTGLVNAVYGVTEITSGYITGNASVTTTTTAVAWPWLTLMALVYFTAGEAMFGATPGKAWIRLKVVRLDGARPTLRDIAVRNIGRLVDFLPLLYLLGGILVITGPYAQRIGDRLANTTVVYRHRPGETRSSGGAAVGALIAVLAAAALVTIVFAYFGRPPLVIDGLAKSGQVHPLRGYELGNASWGVGTVTYPIRETGSNCGGTITLAWSLTSWQLASISLSCPS